MSGRHLYVKSYCRGTVQKRKTTARWSYLLACTCVFAIYL